MSQDHPTIKLVNGSFIEPTTLDGSDDAEVIGLALVGDRIDRWLSSADTGTAETGTADTGSDETVINAEGLFVCPGFIDLQINGGHGADLIENPASMWDLGSVLPRYGVTGFLPTIITSPTDVYHRAMSALTERPEDYRGAEPLGLHFEGPMLSTDRPGVHSSDLMAAPGASVIEGWSRSAGVAVVTLAPELPGAGTVVSALAERGVVVSAGHSVATASDAATAATGGLTMVTHLFNAMGPIHHRDPGLAGFALADDRLSVGLIADGIHVDPLIATLVWRAKGPTQVVLVTDAVAAMGLGPGEYRFSDFFVVADEERVQTLDGTLAGSVLSMDQAVRNMVDYTGDELSSVVAAATSNPARVLGLGGRGSLRPGSVADVTLLDAQLRVVMTICRGVVVYVADEQRDRFGPELATWDHR